MSSLTSDYSRFCVLIIIRLKKLSSLSSYHPVFSVLLPVLIECSGDRSVRIRRPQMFWRSSHHPIPLLVHPVLPLPSPSHHRGLLVESTFDLVEAHSAVSAPTIARQYSSFSLFFSSTMPSPYQSRCLLIYVWFFKAFSPLLQKLRNFVYFSHWAGCVQQAVQHQRESQVKRASF